MKGPVAFPMQYAESMIALTVTFFVWPAVTLESQDKPNTNPVVPTPAARERDLQKITGQLLTRNPFCKKETDFIGPRQKID